MCQLTYQDMSLFHAVLSGWSSGLVAKGDDTTDIDTPAAVGVAGAPSDPSALASNEKGPVAHPAGAAGAAVVAAGIAALGLNDEDDDDDDEEVALVQVGRDPVIFCGRCYTPLVGSSRVVCTEGQDNVDISLLLLMMMMILVSAHRQNPALDGHKPRHNIVRAGLGCCSTLLCIASRHSNV